MEVATAAIKQMQFDVSSDTPGAGGFKSYLDVIFGGLDLDAVGTLKWALLQEFLPHPLDSATDVEAELDIDFQMKRTGKPTKGLTAKLGLNTWNPDLDLQSCTPEERPRWRSAYTINFLYDLINVHCSPVLYRKNILKHDIVPEKEDWSSTGKWQDHREIVGRGSRAFAGDITDLCIHKCPRKEIERMITPHQIFQLQNMIDSFIIWKGWRWSLYPGHTFVEPLQFDPIKDINTFISGYGTGIPVLRPALMHGVMYNRQPRSDLIDLEVLAMVEDDFQRRLGDSVLSDPVSHEGVIPKSRFTASGNRNSLWAYSPYLCAVGLAEAIQYTAELGLTMWERHSETFAILHLYKFLVDNGHVRRIRAFDSFLIFYRNDLFPVGKFPTENHAQVYMDKLAFTTHVLGHRIDTSRPYPSRAGLSPRTHLFSPNSTCKYFRTFPFISLLACNNWRPHDIADDNLPIMFGHLGLLRMAAQGHQGLTDTPLRRRAAKCGTPLEKVDKKFANGIPSAPTKVPSDNLTHEPCEQDLDAHDPIRTERTSQFLAFIERDIVHDVHGTWAPYSGIDYLSFLGMSMMFFHTVQRLHPDNGHVRRALRGQRQYPLELTRTVLATGEKLDGATAKVLRF